MEPHWYDSRENLRHLLSWLIGRDECELNENWLCYWLEKPWKWEPEWGEFLKANPEYKP